MPNDKDPTPLAQIDINPPEVRLLRDPKSERKAVEITFETRLKDDKAVTVLAVTMVKTMANVQFQIEAMSCAEIDAEFAKLPVQRSKAENASN